MIICRKLLGSDLHAFALARSPPLKRPPGKRYVNGIRFGMRSAVIWRRRNMRQTVHSDSMMHRTLRTAW